MFEEQKIREYLELSLTKAEEALNLNNYPVGAVFVNQNGEVKSIEMNEYALTGDLTSHAEIIGMRKLGKDIDKRSDGEFYLFTSLEPCFGCSFFLARTNIRMIYSALKDPHKGGMSDLSQIQQMNGFFKNIKLINEPFSDLANKSRELMKQYFLNVGRADTAKFYEGL